MKRILAEYQYEGEGKTITELPEGHKWIITDIDLTDIDHFGGWTAATEKHFADGANFRLHIRKSKNQSRLAVMENHYTGKERQRRP